MDNFGGGQLSEERKKQIAERLKSALEKEFVLTFNQGESLYKEEEKLEAPGQGGMRIGMMSSSGGPQYKSIKEQKLLQEQEFFGKKFLITDSLPELEWELTSETKNIGQYTCFKATAVRKMSGELINRFGPPPRKEEENGDADEESLKEVVVTAWYTPQIPVNTGPDVYWGLPGLILEVNADRTTILCSKIVINPSEKEEIKVPSKGKKVSQSEYDAIVSEKIKEMREMRGRGGNRGGGRPR